MAVFDLHCGPCDSGMVIDNQDDGDSDHAVWMFANRWAAAHVECGWIVNPNETERLVLGPMDLPADPSDLEDDDEQPGEQPAATID